MTNPTPTARLADDAQPDLVCIAKRDAQTMLAYEMSMLDDAKLLRQRVINSGSLVMLSVLDQRIAQLDAITAILYDALGEDVNP